MHIKEMCIRGIGVGWHVQKLVKKSSRHGASPYLFVCACILQGIDMGQSPNHSFAQSISGCIAYAGLWVTQQLNNVA